jgi:virginiamycin B lyase
MLKGQFTLGVCAMALIIAGCSESGTASTGTANETQTASEEAAPLPGPGPDGWAGAVRGQVTNIAGVPVEGAYVKLRNPQRRLTVMVVSKDEGTFIAGNLPSGRWQVQAIGGDVESEWTQPVTVGAMGTVEANATLTKDRAPDLPAAWPRRVPEEQATLASLPAGLGKDIIAGRCVSCHEANRIVANRVDREAWATTIEEMRAYMKSAGLPDLAEDDSKALLDYVSVNMPAMGPPDPNSRLPRELVEEGEARNYRVVQYELENAGAETHDVAVDPQGIGWSNQRLGGRISRFDPITYEYRELSPPMIKAPKARPGNLQIGKDGIMWLPDPNERRWLSLDTKTEQFTTWPFPESIRGQPNGNSMALHPDGTIWGSGPGAARRLNPVTKEWSTWDTPTWLRTKQNPGGYGIAIDGAGRGWIAMNLVDKMARIDGKTGQVVEYDIPVEGTAYPRRMDNDANGDIWVGLWGASKLMKIDHRTGRQTIIDPPLEKNGAYAVTIDDARDRIWVTLHTADTIGRYNPKTQEWMTYALPQAETDVRRIEHDPNNPNRVWWSTTANAARIGFIELLP